MLMRNTFLFLFRSLNAVTVMRCKAHERVKLQWFLIAFVYLDTFLSSGIVRSAGDTRMSGDPTILIRFRIKAGKPVNQQRDGVCRYQPSYRQQFSH